MSAIYEMTSSFLEFLRVVRALPICPSESVRTRHVLSNLRSDEEARVTLWRMPAITDRPGGANATKACRDPGMCSQQVRVRPSISVTGAPSQTVLTLTPKAQQPWWMQRP